MEKYTITVTDNETGEVIDKPEVAFLMSLFECENKEANNEN